MTAYGRDLAHIHHEGFGFTAAHAAPVLMDSLRDAGLTQGTVVDLGCGSGILSRSVSDAGYRAFGIDYSEDMIALARRNVPEGEFIRGSVLDAELPPCVAVAAIGEIFCYAFDDRAGLETFTKVMRRIYHALVPGGLFLFDVAGPGRVNPSPRTGFVDHDDWSIIHHTTESGRTVTRKITTFTRDGNRYRRTDETHVLRLYTPQEVLDALAQIGFEATPLTAYGEFTLPTGWHPFLARKPAG